MDSIRRRFLIRLLHGSSLLLGLGGIATRSAPAMGRYPQGIRKMTGKVTVDGKPAQVGDIVRFGNTVETAPAATVIFVVESAVVLLRENTRLQLRRERIGETDTIDVLQLLEGKLLGVFSRRRAKRLQTATAVVGIRGSGAYAETDPQATYLCTCYGHAEIRAAADPQSRESVTTRHHEAPRYIDAAGRIHPAPVINHTDAELILLESMVGRRPPFAGSGGRDY